MLFKSTIGKFAARPVTQQAKQEACCTKQLNLNSKGIIYSPTAEAVERFLQESFAGFNISKLLADLDTIARERNFVWSTIQVVLSEEQELKIHHEVAFPLRPLSVIRRLPKPSGERRVVHEEMVIPHTFQKQGLSGDFMRAYYQ